MYVLDQAGNSGRPSPFAAQSSAKVGQAAEALPQQMSLQSIASMFGSTPLTTADLQKYQSAGLNLANFPSLPSVRAVDSSARSACSFSSPLIVSFPPLIGH